MHARCLECRPHPCFFRCKKTKPNSFVFHTCTFTDTFYIVITTFWSLGFIAFGGPQAHVAILREHLVIRRNWINEEEFMELFAIGQVRACIRGGGDEPPCVCGYG